MIDDHDRCEWLNVSSGTCSPVASGQRAVTLVVAAVFLNSSMSQHQTINITEWL